MASVIDRPPSTFWRSDLGRQQALDDGQDGIDTECEQSDEDGASEELRSARARASPSTMKRPRPP